MRRLICVLLGSLIASLSGQIPGVIPQPMSHVIGQNCDYSQAVFLVKNAPNGAFYLQEYAQNQHFLGFDFHATSFRIDPQAQKGKAVLEFERFAPQDLWYGQKEAYALRFEPRRIRIQYNEPQGAMYAFSTLLQALHSHPEGLPYQSIVDQPQFAYRGMHLDVCRHFFDTAFIMRYLDLMALYKMNTFHWHLTEDQAWRLEIKAYPRLTEIGAQRNSTQYGPYRDQTFDSLPYGGYYSQDQVRRLVQYAALRGITVIPEIELPGHSSAALAAYPHLGCTGGPYEVQAGWGVFDDVYCAGKDSTFIFLQTVMDEVCALFPSGYVHIGGDECPKTRWKECPHCQARMNQEGLADEHELQSYFIRRMEKHLNQKGKTIIGWDEILEGGLAPNATVMSWRGVSG
ncbi:MAG: beta-N-acetylhexosaminidase, partial [Bacteroidia bacterium]